MSAALAAALLAPVVRQATAGALASAGRPVVGAPAPAFTGALLGGGRLSLDDLRGKPALLNFFASWCPPCRAEAPDLTAFERANRDRIRVVGMNLTATERSEADIVAFLDAFGVEYPTLLDPGGAIAETYRVRLIPVSYFLDARGIVRFVVVGPMTRAVMEGYLDQLD